MATIDPSVVNSPKETATSKGGYLRLTITSISDSDATTNKRYIGCKLTIEGTRWVGLYKWESTLGGQTVSTETRTVENWYTGHVLATKNLTFDNDNAGNLSLTAYIKHLFYKGSGSWNTSYAKSITTTLVCSQLPRYANFTSHSATSTLNTITVSYAANANYTGQQYSLDGGAWTNCSAGSYTLTGFTPGSTHTIKTRIYRSDSGLETQSSQISVTLKSLPTSNTPSNTNFNSNGTSVSGSISSTDYLSGWYIIVKDGNNEIINGSGSKATTTSKSWSCSSANATAMLSRHGSNNSWSLSVEYYVVSNETIYQLTTRTCTCILPNGTYLPTFTNSNLSYEVTNSTSNNITGSNQKVIKGISVVRAKYTAASPQGGASMSSYLATSGTKSGSSNASTLYADINGAVDASSFSVQATDSRGRSTVASKDYTTYIDYFAPYTNSGGVNIARVDGVGANIRISISGKYKYWSGLQNPNTITQVSVKYKLKSSSTYNNININLSISYDSSNNFTATGTTTGDLFDIGNEYDVQVILKDVFNNLPVNASIPTGTVLMWKDLANNRIGIGKKPGYTLDVNGDIYTAAKYRIRKGASYGIYNTDGNLILSDYGNNNVVLNAANGTLYLGYQNTTSINILNGKANINSNGDLQANSYISKEGRIASADLAHQYPNDKVSMKLNISSGSMTTHKPSADGFIQTFFWDNSGQYETQFFLANGDGIRPSVRTRGGQASWTGSWRELAWRSDIPSVPTKVSQLTNDSGFIINDAQEIGTSGIWRYIKWKNGYALCVGRQHVSTKINVAWGGIYESGDVVLDNYPFTFVELPYVLYQTHPYNQNPGGGGYSAFIMGGQANTTTTSPGIVNLLRGKSEGTARNYDIVILAFGKWKN